MEHSPRPVAIDLFAGAGGLSLGLEQAGFDVRAAVEIDPVHAATHAFNFPECFVFPRSVEVVAADAILAATGLKRGMVDLVAGGAPCQGFSLIGKRNLDDPRNRLVLHFARLVRDLDAKAFLFENVKGLTVGRHKAVLNEFIEMMQGYGYDVVTPVRVLNAMDHGVPQDRERVFVLGVKRGHALPVYPNVTHSSAPGSPLPPTPTCADALDDLPDIDLIAELTAADCAPVKLLNDRSRYAQLMRCEITDAIDYSHQRFWDPSVLTSSMRTDHSAISRSRFRSAQPGSIEPVSRFFKLAANGVSNTLRAGTDGARGAFTSPRPIHYRHDRCISVREMARLHGFPDWFRFHVTKWHGARQIGNSVPPPLARAVGSTLITALGFAPRQGTRKFAAQNESLLRMSVTQAAEHFGVAAPCMKRDQPGSYRKPKQSETGAAWTSLDQR